jgi:hypothetical protein
MEELTRQLNQKDAELDQEVDDIIEADLDALDRDIESTRKDLREGLRPPFLFIKYLKLLRRR